MPPSTDLSSACLGMAVGIAMIALFLALHQRYERRAREVDLSEADRRHFAREDRRRAVGVNVLVLLAAVIALGSRVEPRIKGKANVYFVQHWLLVLGLIIVLLSLAMIDWIATRKYSNRQRQAMIREHLDEIREQARRVAAARRAREHGPDKPT